MQGLSHYCMTVGPWRTHAHAHVPWKANCLIDTLFTIFKRARRDLPCHGNGKALFVPCGSQAWLIWDLPLRGGGVLFLELWIEQMSDYMKCKAQVWVSTPLYINDVCIQRCVVRVNPILFFPGFWLGQVARHNPQHLNKPSQAI